MLDTNQRPFPETVKGQSGKSYKIERTLQDKGNVLGRVFLAVEGNTKYILKEIPRKNFGYKLETYRRLGHCPHIRDLEDTAPDHSILVFKYFNEHLLSLVQRNLPVATTKLILKNTLRGIAAMHAKHIVHNDIKPNNIFLQVSEGPSGPIVQQSTLSDLEDSAYCPPPNNLQGMRLGNSMWRAPEAHAEGPINRPSDIFSFAIVCIYAVTRGIIFHVFKEELDEGVEVLAIVLERQLSFFGDRDAFTGLIECMHNTNPDNPWIEIFNVIWSGFDAEHPRQPFSLWEDVVDEEFRELILKMTCLDPRRRITADEALQHAWFKDV